MAELALLPASFLNHSGDVSWEFRPHGGQPTRAGVRLTAREAVRRRYADGGHPPDLTGKLMAHAAAAVLLPVAPDAAGVRWVTPANLDAVHAVVREHERRADPLYADGE